MDDEIQNRSIPTFNESLDKMMGEAWNEVKEDFSNGTGIDRAASTAKLVGKGSFYVGVKFIQNLPDAIQRMKEKQGK
ncbi:hypothetical protein [Pseudomonas sp. PA27(2017)]|uniref:hypothetical protein n=1 Tax=Pseudomonas sp. PA27(2017) TaxID=1932112 RepID=UPI000969FD33|nr:hypothetical protein [Pseudomonas sp. PA27(2017)]OLU30653.1 hypothetical protein BVH06_15600 [Pseudomonas sp. PA27(2017)]